MAKKYKRSVPSKSTSQSVNSVAQAAAVEKAPAFSPFRRVAAEFNPDYSHVIKDLQRIGILAGTFFVILIILSFFLNH
jgi:hypothetical protein